MARRTGLVVAGALVAAVAAGCGAATGNDGNGTSGSASVSRQTTDPAALVGLWRVDGADGEERDAVLRLDDQGLTLWRDCGSLSGGWAADASGLFVGHVFGAGNGCLSGTVPDDLTPGWLRRVTSFGSDAKTPVLRDRDGYGRVLLLYGARTPADLLFLDEIETWRQAHGVDVGLVVDAGGPGWSGEVGLVTRLIPGIELDAGTATAFVAGPEIMMRFVAEDLHTRGLDLDSVHVTLERTMRCGVALCGRCQVGPTLVCRDGAVYRYSDVGPLLSVKEL